MSCVQKQYVWNPATCRCENGKYLANINDDSEISCDKITEETKLIPKIFNKKQVAYKTKNYIYLTYLLINYHSIIDSCQYLLLPDKISKKQKLLLPYHMTNNK